MVAGQAGEYSVGSLVRIRQRDGVVLPSDDADIVCLRPLSGSESQICGIDRAIEGQYLRPAEWVSLRRSAKILTLLAQARSAADTTPLRTEFFNGLDHTNFAMPVRDRIHWSDICVRGISTGASRGCRAIMTAAVKLRGFNSCSSRFSAWSRGLEIGAFGGGGAARPNGSLTECPQTGSRITS
jgi:hypothetical protein